VGDKVMQIKNNYQLEWERKSRYGVTYDRGNGIFNGDTGVIEDINFFSEQMLVRFEDDRFVYYDFTQLDELELAYAITIHKSQGSEYPAVLIPMFPGPRMLMYRCRSVQAAGYIPLSFACYSACFFPVSFSPLFHKRSNSK